MKRYAMIGLGAILTAAATSSAAQTPSGVPASQESVQELTRRVEALERILAPIIGQSEQTQRGQQLLRAQLERLAEETVGELAAVRAELAKHSTLLTRTPAQPLGGTAGAPPAAPLPPGASSAAAAAGDAPPPDYLARARTSIQEQAWGQAEFDASAQLALTAQGEKAAEANYLLGRSLLGQGHVASAAEKFLAVYDSKPPAALAAENLFYLGEALRQLGLPDNTQLCAVYAETLQQHGTVLGADRIAEIRTHLAQQNCS